MSISRKLKALFWKLPMPPELKRKWKRARLEAWLGREDQASEKIDCVDDLNALKSYTEYTLSLPIQQKDNYVDFESHAGDNSPVILIAYYLTQFSPDRHNDEWWGKGSTEWDNVARAVPQFVGHYQPRLPGELGFYDLRVKDVMRRQIELAQNYGVNVFSFYYYWFDGERILENPLNMFLQDKSLDMPFIICWANENWTRKYSGTNDAVLIAVKNTTESYKKFIVDAIACFKDPRYFRIDGKPVLQVYRPYFMPESQTVISYWRETVKKEIGTDLFIIACRNYEKDWIAQGFDGMNEWMPSCMQDKAKEITDKTSNIRKTFPGRIYDYKEAIENKKYKTEIKPLLFRAVTPMWDNTARRNNRGLIWHGSTPALYKQWLSDVIKETLGREDLPAPLVFINAWNEWGEGAYLEPDRKFGYAYLQATWEAKNEAASKS